MVKTLYIFCFCLLLYSPTFAQKSYLGSWYSTAVLLPGDSVNRWGACAGFQIRNDDKLRHLIYREVNGGLTFFINKSFTTMVGFGKYNTFSMKDDHSRLSATEYRLYEQITNNQFLERLKLEHRYMAEQRWSNEKYRNRFRYRISLYVPINHTKVEEKTWYLACSDEIFLNNRLPHLERNRVNIGFGYQFSRSIILQTGWVNQCDYTSDTATYKNSSQFLLIYRILRNSGAKREYMPSTVN